MPNTGQGKIFFEILFDIWIPEMLIYMCYFLCVMIWPTMWRPDLAKQKVWFFFQKITKIRFLVNRIFEYFGGRLLLQRLYSLQFLENIVSIWLHVERRCSASCWCFDSPSLTTFGWVTTSESPGKVIFLILQMKFWRVTFRANL